MVNEKSLRKYCCDPIENIHGYWRAKNDPTQMYDTHHIEEDNGFSHKQLKRLGRYYNIPANMLIILTREEHRKRHKGRRMSDEHRQKIIAANTGRRMSDEHRQKIIAANTGRTASEETRQKISKANKGKVITEKHKTALRYERTEETRRKLSESKTKYHIDQTELRHLREDLGYTLKQCAEYFKTSLMTVSRACRKIPK